MGDKNIVELLDTAALYCGHPLDQYLALIYIAIFLGHQGSF